jgi:hypothetical protein
MARHSGHRFLPVVPYDSSLAPKSMRFLLFLGLLLSALPVFAQGPGKPTNFSAEAGPAKTVILKWTAPAGTPVPTGYHVYRAAPPGTNFERITNFNQVPASASTFTDSSAALVAGTLYTYRITPYIGQSEETTVLGTDSDTATATPVNTPGAPGNLRATNITSTSVSLAWDTVTGATSYNVYRDDELVGEDVLGTTYQDTGLTLSTTYIYHVTANSAGGESGESNALTVTTFGDGTGKEAAWAKRFRQVDVDADGVLTYEEFLAGHGARLAEVVILHRFEYSDTDDSGDITLTEYAKSFGGRKYMSPSRPRQFFLADGDGNGALDPEELALTLGAKVARNSDKVIKLFNKKNKIKDDEGDLWLSEVEFGIKGGSLAEPDDVITPEEPETP